MSLACRHPNGWSLSYTSTILEDAIVERTAGEDLQCSESLSEFSKLLVSRDPD